MIRAWRRLALLLLAAPLRAQTRVVVAPTIPVYSAPAAASASLFAPTFAAPALGTQVLAAPSVLTLATPQAPLPLAAAAPALALAPAPALSALPAAADGPRRIARFPSIFRPDQTPATAHDYGAKFFDGAKEVASHSGSVFTPTSRPHPAVQGPLVLQLKSRPAAPASERSAAGLFGSALLEKVTEDAKRGHHGSEDYRAASHYLFKTADHVRIGGVSGVVDAYSGVFVPGTSEDGSAYGEKGDQDGDGYVNTAGMNVEHVWPQSFFSRRLPMRTDLHHLMATFEHPNGMRSNLPFGVVKGQPEYHNGAGAKLGGGVFEPPDITKGRVARALLYFYTRYRDVDFFGSRSAAFWNQQLDVILDWNRRFPPDAEEQARNGLVEAFQGNRNPFVDDSTLADRIGADALRATTVRSAFSTSLRDAGSGPERRSDVPRKGKKRFYYRPRTGRGGRRR